MLTHLAPTRAGPRHGTNCGSRLPFLGRHHPGIIHKLLLLALVPALVVTVAGCGTSAESVEFAPPQVIEVGTHELDGRNGVGFTLEVRRLRLTRSGWEVAARVVNSTPVSWSIERPHELGPGTKFGLFVASKPNALRPMALEAEHLTTPQLLAVPFDPPIPQLLHPAEGWSGRFSGPGRIRRGNYVKFAFGRFVTDQQPPADLPASLMALTAHAVRVG